MCIFFQMASDVSCVKEKLDTLSGLLHLMDCHICKQVPVVPVLVSCSSQLLLAVNLVTKGQYNQQTPARYVGKIIPLVWR